MVGSVAIKQATGETTERAGHRTRWGFSKDTTELLGVLQGPPPQTPEHQHEAPRDGAGGCIGAGMTQALGGKRSRYRGGQHPARRPTLSLVLLGFCDFRNMGRVARRHGLLL